MRLVFLFCEGAQDIALLRRLLLCSPGAKESTRAIKDYPQPFNDFWMSQLKEVVAGAAKRPAEHRGKLVPPWLEVAYETNDALYLLFDMGGKDQRPKIAEMLKDWKLLLDSPFGGPIDVEDWATIMVVDADDEGVDARIQDVFAWFKEQGLLRELPAALANPHWEPCDGYSLGGLVVHSPESDRGAVEDIWLPLARTKVADRILGAEEFIDKHQIEKSKVTKAGWRRKALLTIAGQIEHPNDSLAVILRSVKWVEDGELVAMPLGQKWLGFLMKTRE